MRLIYMGTPQFAVPALHALHAAAHEIAAVYTQPPRAAHRGKAETPSPVHRAAAALGLEVRTPASLRDKATQADFAALAPEIAVIAAYGLILPRPVLDAPLRGCINLHASLLPRWRGAAPVQRAILAGDTETGLTLMQMEPGLDTGPMLMAERTPVGSKTAGALTEELASMGAAMIVQALADPAALKQVAQDEALACYAAKIDKAESRLDFTRPAIVLERAVRAFNPQPGAWFEVGAERIRVLAAEVIPANGAPGTVLDDRLTIACGDGALRPLLVQRAGRSALPVADMLRGLPVPAGTRLS